MVENIDKSLLAILVSAAVAILALTAEALHAQRVRAVAALAFGPSRRPLAWAYGAPLFRIASFAALAWGLVTLYYLPPTAHREGEVKPHEIRRLVLVLDVSPSMKLKDAGPNQDQRRDQRAADLLQSFFNRVNKERFRTSVIATYSSAKPVVQDTTDLEVVRNILTDLPLSQAFKSGPTNLYAGIQEAVKLAKPWPPGSTIILVVSDGGDPEPGVRPPQMPAAISHVVVVGVGSPNTGKFIDGVLSRQDVSSLRQLAGQLSGSFHNGNENHLSTDLVQQMDQPPGGATKEPLTRREYALIAIASGATTLALLPLLLSSFGTLWRPGAQRKSLAA
jgi:Ca-activated chloride channel family protein